MRRFTTEEYLQLERASRTKNEYIAGFIYSMADGTIDRARIIKNLERLLHPQLEGGDCETWPADLKIGVSRDGPYFYPDLSVICGEPLLLDSSRDCALNPIVVFEILSKSTRKYDRETKALSYREIHATRHIVLISQDSISVEHSFRSANGKWKTEKLTDRNTSLELTAIKASLRSMGFIED